MDETPPNVRTRKEIKQGLLKKAIKEGRGPEMILLIQWRLKASQNISPEEKDILEEAAHVNDGQPKSVRMLNALARHKGESTRYVHTETLISEGPPTLQ